VTCSAARTAPFRVIAIREGRETGVTGVSELYEVGCLAMMREVNELPDGRYELITVGTDRFKLHDVDDSQPYLRGELEVLAEQTGEETEAGLVAIAVQRSFRAYLDVLAARGPATISVPKLPDEPILLSYLVAASVIIDLPARQSLLAQPDALSRLNAERTLLARETAILRELGTTPHPICALALQPE